jgi:hypothetical protein
VLHVNGKQGRYLASWYGGGCDKDDKLLAVLAAARRKFRFLAQFSQSQRHFLLHRYATLSATSPKSSRARLPIIMPPNFYEYPRLSYLRYDAYGRPLRPISEEIAAAATDEPTLVRTRTEKALAKQRLGSMSLFGVCRYSSAFSVGTFRPRASLCRNLAASAFIMRG